MHLVASLHQASTISPNKASRTRGDLETTFPRACICLLSIRRLREVGPGEAPVKSSNLKGSESLQAHFTHGPRQVLSDDHTSLPERWPIGHVDVVSW